MTDKKALDHLNLCLQTARMGIWGISLLKETGQSFDITWDAQVRKMHGMDENYQGDIIEWFRKYIHPEDFPEVEDRLAKFVDPTANQQNHAFKYRFCWPNGEVHHIEMHASVDMNSTHADHINIYGVARDITQDVLRVKTIEEQKNRLLSASRMAVLGEISGGIAHEINNPLTVIQARSFQLQQMCEQGKLDAAKIKAAAESISKTGDKIAKIIKSLRAFAHGQESDPMDKINVHELIQETLDFCKIRFYNHGIDMRVGEIPQHLEFECRLTQMEEALLSLFNNAHDAVTALPDKWISIEVFDKGPDIEIQITDSGTGISDEIASQMMLPFFSTKEMGKGMGLGLCIASETISKHQGNLTYNRSHPNTQFVIRLPKKQK